MQTQTFTFKVPASLGHSALVRKLAMEIFSMTGFSRPWQSRLQLVVDELFMNAVRYGSAAGDFVTLDFSFDDREARCTVSDDGHGPRPISAEELKAIVSRNSHELNATKTSGRGIALIAQLWTDRLTIEKNDLGGLSVGFSKAIETAAPPRPPEMERPVSHPASAEAPAFAEAPASAEATAGGVYTLVLSGETNSYTADEVTAPVYRLIGEMPSGSVLELDLKDVTYINSTFVGHVADWYRQLTDKSGSLRLHHVAPPVRDVLELVGLSQIISIH